MRNLNLDMVLNAVPRVIFALLLVTCACLSAEPSPKPESNSSASTRAVTQHYPAHTIHFPQQAVGKVYLLRDLLDRGVVKNKPFSFAKGDVEVPAGKLVLLDVSYEGGENLSWVKEIKPDDIQVLFFMRADISEDDCRKLAIMHGMKVIDFRESDVAGAGFKYILEGMPVLQEVNISRTNASDETLAAVAVLKHLENLKLGSTAVTNKGIEQLSGLTTLLRLEFPKTRVNDKALLTVAKLQNLVFLSIDENFIGDEAVLSLSKLPKLWDLRMGSTRITDAALKTLSSNRFLGSLDVHNTKITSNGVKFFAGSSIARLVLENTLVDDQCVPTLCKMRLNSLNIRSTRITPAGVAKIKAANSQCVVTVGKEIPILPPGD